MSKLEKLLLAMIVLEIPIQLGAYVHYQEHEASFGAIGGIQVTLTTLCLIGLYALWMFRAALRPRRAGVRWSLLAPLLAYVGIVAFSVLVAPNRYLAVSYLFLLGQAALLFLYVACRMQQRSDVVFLLSLLACSVALQSLAVIGTWLLASQLAGRQIGFGPLSLEVWKDGRPCGLMATPVAAWSYLALLLVPVGSLLLMPISKLLKLLALLAVVSGALGVLTTQSRGAVLAVAVAAVISAGFVCLRGWLPRWAVAVAVLLIVVAAFPAMELVKKRVAVSDEGSAVSRIHLAQIAWRLIQDHPLSGVGANNYHVAAERYATSALFRSEWHYTVHCMYLLVWAESGLLALAAFLAFLLSVIYQGWRVWRLRDPLFSPVGLAIAATVLGQMTHMVVDMFNSGPYTLTFCLAAAIVVGMVRLSQTAGANAISDVRSVSPPLSLGHGQLRYL